MKRRGSIGASCFNPRPHEGGDQQRGDSYLHQGGFNPRPHEGGDVPRGQTVPATCCFNPRPHEGGDTGPTGSMDWDEFQPTPPRRGRHELGLDRFNPVTVSTHAPTKGATLTGETVSPEDRVSTHAPTKGATTSLAACA